MCKLKAVRRRQEGSRGRVLVRGGGGGGEGGGRGGKGRTGNNGRMHKEEETQR